VKPWSGPGPDANAIARSDACKQQTADLESYRAATGLQQTDALGNVHEFSEKERLAFLEKTEKKVQETCGPAPSAPPAAAAAPTAPPPPAAPPAKPMP
jgi:hypothetical protein